MLVVHCQGEPNETERAMARVLEGDGLPGLVLVNYRLPGMEVDGLVIAPDRVCCIEAKGIKDQRGELVPRLNGPWTVGDEPVQFAGGASNPGVQARKQAQQLKRYLVDHGLSRYFIPSIVAVDGPEISCPPTSVGTDQVVTELARLPEAG